MLVLVLVLVLVSVIVVVLVLVLEFQRQAFQTLLINRDIQHKRLTETVSWCQG